MKIKNTAERRFFVFVTYIFSMFKSSYGKKGKDDVLKKSLAAALIAGLFLFALCGYVFVVKGGEYICYIQPLDCYAVSLGSFEKENEAEVFSQSVFQRGGGGNVFFDGKRYFVLAEIFLSEADCDAVVKNLVSSGEKAEKLDIKLGAKTLRLSSSSECSSLKNICEEIVTIYQGLHEKTAAYDDGKCSFSDLSKTASSASQKLFTLCYESGGDRFSQIISQVKTSAESLYSASQSENVASVRKSAANCLLLLRF